MSTSDTDPPAPRSARAFQNRHMFSEKKITRMIVSTSMLVLGSRSSHSDSSELFVSLFGSMKRKKENKRLEERLVRQGGAAQELWAAWEWATVRKMLLKKQTKPKPTANRGKQRQRHAFAREAAVILQVVQVVKTARKQREEEVWPPCWSNRVPRPQPFAGRLQDGRAVGARAPGWRRLGSPLCTCRGDFTRLTRRKASAKEKT